MYCPKCSQQQVSDEVRFCSRCGFQLGVVKELLIQSDALPAPDGAEVVAPTRALRKRDVTIGAALMYVISVVVLIISSPIPPLRNDQIFILTLLFSALILFINFISPLMRAVGKLFGEDAAASRKTQLPQPSVASGLVTQVSAASHRAALPRMNTAEMLQPPSITEHTTNLLKRD